MLAVQLPVTRRDARLDGHAELGRAREQRRGLAALGRVAEREREAVADAPRAELERREVGPGAGVYGSPAPAARSRLGRGAVWAISQEVGS